MNEARTFLWTKSLRLAYNKKVMNVPTVQIEIYKCLSADGGGRAR